MYTQAGIAECNRREPDEILARRHEHSDETDPKRKTMTALTTIHNDAGNDNIIVVR